MIFKSIPMFRKWFLSLTLLLALVSCEVATCYDDPTLADLRVNSAKVACTGVGPMQCLQVQQNEKIGGPDWTLLYQGIEGFTHQEGFVYDLRVRITKVPSPPADGSSLRYTLVKEISSLFLLGGGEKE